MNALRVANLGVRFLLELGSLAAFGYWGWTLRGPTAARLAAAVGLPLLVGAGWGLFVSPRARYSTGRVGQASLGLVVFLAAAGALYARGHVRLAAVGGAVAALSSLLVYAPPD